MIAMRESEHAAFVELLKAAHAANDKFGHWLSGELKNLAAWNDLRAALDKVDAEMEQDKRDRDGKGGGA